MAEGLPQRQEAEDANVSAPIFSALNTGAPILSAPMIGAPNLSETGPLAEAVSDATPSDLAVNSYAPHFSAPDFSAPLLGAPAIGAPEFAFGTLGMRRGGTKTYTIHSISRMEDVLTSAERDLLRWLWEKGRPVPATQRIRLVTGPNGEGARRLATQAGLIYNTFKNLTRALSTKLALDIVKPEKNLPTIYAVYHDPVILERQRQAGFTGAIHKNGGGRELVNDQAQPAPRRPDLAVDELEQIIGAPNFGAPNIGAPHFGAATK